MQAADKGTKLVDEDGLFSLVTAAPETAAAAAKPEVKAEGASALAAIPAGNFYAGKSSAATGTQAKKAALSASSMAASGVLFALDLPSTAHVMSGLVTSLQHCSHVFAAQQLLLVNRFQGTALGQPDFWLAHACNVSEVAATYTQHKRSAPTLCQFCPGDRRCTQSHVPTLHITLTLDKTTVLILSRTLTLCTNPALSLPRTQTCCTILVLQSSRTLILCPNNVLTLSRSWSC